jgi:hypothetical protein
MSAFGGSLLNLKVAPFVVDLGMAKYPTNGTGYLSLQANIICLLLALVGTTAIIQHPNWFGRVPPSEMTSPSR